MWSDIFYIPSGSSEDAQNNMVLSATGELEEGNKHPRRVYEAAWDKFRERDAVCNESFKYTKYLLSVVIGGFTIHEI